MRWAEALRGLVISTEEESCRRRWMTFLRHVLRCFEWWCLVTSRVTLSAAAPSSIFNFPFADFRLETKSIETFSANSARNSVSIYSEACPWWCFLSERIRSSDKFPFTMENHEQIRCLRTSPPAMINRAISVAWDEWAGQTDFHMPITLRKGPSTEVAFHVNICTIYSSP